MGRSAGPGYAGAYLRGRVMELFRPESRAVSEPLAEWAVRRIRLEGRPFRFEGHAYLKAIYDDPSPHIVLMKAAQIGGTTWAVLRSLHACLGGLSVIYFFPTRTDVLEFSKSRVGPLIADNPFLAKKMADTDTAGLKRIGPAHLYFRGMQSAVGLKSIPADLVVFDELDEATPDAKTRARERLSHSSYRRVIELSNPSIPGYGIDEVFQESDQRQWTVRCSGCAHWTGLESEWPTELGREVKIVRLRPDGTGYRACPRCGHELDVERGEWVAEFPGRPIRGYRISQLLSPIIDPGEILRDYRTTRFPERFYNLKIGIAWADAQNRVDAATVLRCCGKDPIRQRSETPCTMGVDTGKQFHVVISRFLHEGKGVREIVYLGVHDEIGEIDSLMERFRVRTCVIDALPEIHVARGLAGRHRGRVWLNYFLESQRGRFRWNRDEQIVQENRTEALDASRQVVREGTIVLPRRCRLVEEFAEHMASNAKRLVEDPETGAQTYRYVRGGADHFSLAFTYDCIAWSRDRYGDGGARLGRVAVPRWLTGSW